MRLEGRPPVFCKGFVKKINLMRGFGFIEPHEGGELVIYFEKAALEDLEFDADLVGRRVEYQMEESLYGPMAVRVRKEN